MFNQPSFFGFQFAKTSTIPNTGILISGTWTSPQTRLYATQNTGNTPLATFNSNIGTGISNYFASGVPFGNLIFLGGYFTTYNGVSAPYFAVLNRTTGALVSSGLGSGFNQSVRYIHVQNDGKIICAGTFTSYNGISVNGIVRLNTNYTIDGTFNVGTGFNGAVEGGCFDSQHVYLVGQFTQYKGVSRAYIVKIDKSNGADSTGAVSGFNANCFTAFHEGGHIWIGGNSFTTYNGASCPTSIIKLDKNTMLPDANFSANIGVGCNGRVFFDITGDGSDIYINGNFSLVSSQSRNQLAKISYNGILGAALGFSPSGGSILFGGLFFNKKRYFISGGFTNVNPRFVVLDVVSNTTLPAYNITFPSGLGTNCIEF